MLRDETGSYRGSCKACLREAQNLLGKKSYNKRKAEDPEYLERRAQQHRDFMANNPEKLKEYQDNRRRNIKAKLLQIITSAQVRGKDVHAEEMDLLRSKLALPCHYCAFAPGPADNVNGLDRMDSAGEYSDANTVPCCAPCNFMKGVDSADLFIRKVREAVKRRGEVFEGEQQDRMLPLVYSSGRAVG